MDAVEIESGHSLRGEVRLAGSKSITNRALVCAAASPGITRILGPATARDSLDLRALLERAGVPIDGPREGPWDVRGRARGPADLEGTYDLGEGGTVARFFTAWAASGGGDFVLDAAPRMRERPMLPLAHALIELGAAVSTAEGGRLPWRIRTSGLRGAALRISTQTTSQIASALLLIGPLQTTGRLELLRIGERRSEPYLDLTRAVMQHFGVTVERDDARLVVPEGTYRETPEFLVEPDASSAALLFVGAAITGGRVLVHGLGGNALQGDRVVVDLLERMGARVERNAVGTLVGGPVSRPLSVDLRDHPDLVPALAIAAATLPEESTFLGIAHLGLKESDRPAELERGLTALGASVRREEDELRIRGPLRRGAVLDPANDHRLAMGYALAGLVQPGVVVENAGCVAKSFPDFFQVLQQLAPGCVRPHAP